MIRVEDAFVTRAACREMLEEAADGGWIRSQLEGPFDFSEESERKSESLILPNGFSQRATKWLRRVETNLASILSVKLNCLEPWQMIRYRRGCSYDYHLDCGAWKGHPSGERARTLMLILEQPERGGATHFRALAQTIRPLVGRLVVWRNLLPDGACNHAMIHSGRPVWAGRMTILIT
ncbi:2OG-Fe(II) oxygenase [Pseudomonas laurentiana]